MTAVAGSSDRQLSNGTFDGLKDTLIDVRGRVTDENGEPLAGATVQVKGTKKGTTTDANGEFVLKNVDGNAVIVISSVGYETQKVNVNGKSDFRNIVLKRNDSKLDEVIVNKGYYTESQRLTTGNVSTVTAKDIEKQPVSNPLLALQGRVPGIEITQTTGVPGGGVIVRIQGQNSIRQNGNDPLFIVDGVPYPSQLLKQQGPFGDPAETDVLYCLNDY